ncbi:MAG TPA: inositol monophosphatase, partial [Erythrobacter sp.]|nr:inositol monophosphatase [Erythrobacter sp.]
GWGDVTAGVIYNPVTDETFWAEKTRGAWLHDGRLRVSARRNLADSLIATGIPFQGHGDFGDWTKIFAAIGPQVAGIRRFGAASLDLAWLAAGRFDGFWESDLNDWDTAAGCLIVREAGGFVSDFRGRSQPIHAKQILAANDALHSKLHKLLANALKA